MTEWFFYMFRDWLLRF